MTLILGGQGDWRQHLTLPNILKEYNANLTGFSLGDGLSQTLNAQMNVAVNGAMDQDLPHEAIELVRRMRKDKRIDFKNHWKVHICLLLIDMCATISKVLPVANIFLCAAHHCVDRHERLVHRLLLRTKPRSRRAHAKSPKDNRLSVRARAKGVCESRLYSM